MNKLAMAVLIVIATSSAAQTADNAIDVARTKIAMKMKDPESVKFSDLVLWSNDGTPIVCGWINAKNSYGGYVGYTPFIVSDSLIDVRSKEPRSSILSNRAKFDELWVKCNTDPESSLGDSLVELTEINVEKKCRSLYKVLDKKIRVSRISSCVESENNAKSWLRTHKTSPEIALSCAREAQSYYSSGKLCVFEAEANVIYSRGPKTAGYDQ